MLDLLMLFQKYNIPPKGVIHIGAHEGSEATVYQKLGISKVLFIEANPDVYSRLVENMKKFSNVQCVCYAISNKTGTTSLHITSMDQSSSILSLKHHKVVYPSITEVKCVGVPCSTLDNLLKVLNLDPSIFNFINIDIQGAEMLAFQGAEELLKKHIVAVNSEVNYKEMYEGCALKKDIDSFLGQFGFICKETILGDPTWGDAFYVKK